MVMVKWSAYLPFTPTIPVLILLMTMVFSVKFVFEKNENKQESWSIKKLTQRCSKKAEMHASKAMSWPVNLLGIQVDRYIGR